MAWELLSIWVIVIVAITWFLRDEKRRRADAELERAARYYAHAPRYRHVSVEPLEPPVAAPKRRDGGLSAEQRRFIAALAASRESAQS